MKLSHPSPVAVVVQRPDPFSLSPAAFSFSDSSLLSWVYFGFELIDGLAFITRLTTRGLLKVICNVNTFVINHIFFRLRLTFMNIKALWMGSASGSTSVRGRGTGCLHCAGEAIRIHRRAKGSGGRRREVEHERV